MKLLDVVKVVATGQIVRICGFADFTKLPKRDERYYENVAADFDRDSGIPHEFDLDFKGKEPSKDALFCEWHEADESHPLHKLRAARCDKLILHLQVDDNWRSHPIAVYAENIKSGKMPIADLSTPAGITAMLAGKAAHPDAELPFVGKVSEMSNLSDELVKYAVLLYVNENSKHAGYVHAWFKPAELEEV